MSELWPAMVLGFLLLLMLGTGFAAAVEGPLKERARKRRALNDIEIARAKKRAELELLLLERQHLWSLEDIQAHRARLERQLDQLHAEEQ